MTAPVVATSIHLSGESDSPLKTALATAKCRSLGHTQSGVTTVRILQRLDR